MVPKLINHNQFYQWTEWNMKSTLIVMILLDWLGFALLSERILATIKCRTYENDQSRWFCITAGIFLVNASLSVVMLMVHMNDVCFRLLPQSSAMPQPWI
jgi:hypothetical protein